MAPPPTPPPLVLCLLALALLACCRAADDPTQTPAACSIPGASCRLPGDISQWSRIPGFAGKQRVWDAASLRHGMRHMGDPHYVGRLLDKLNSGQRIVAVAIGSSVVHGMAGCWQPSLESLFDLGIIPNP